jgi:2-succinyl-5-enolpyruvyl-6-hydroxy-3-cyclohexene-1-carboxylate synthase
MSVAAGTPAGDADGQAAFACTLVDEWVRGGVTDAVVCPGSRSTPLAVALAAHSDMTVHVRLDERSAGFTALGIGKATGIPALVVTTSGTAAAELHAAVVEADLARVPLIACTADRPPELRDVGAPQTIDQTHLFGRSVRWFCDPGVPDRSTRDSWRSLAARALAESTAGQGGPGPVQLNLPFREPLLGDPAGAGGTSPGRPEGQPWHQVVTGPTPPPVGATDPLVAWATGDTTRRGVIVAGAGCGDPSDVLALSDALGWPVLADPRSGVRLDRPGVIATADGILRSPRFAAGHVPDAVLHLGEPWVSKVVTTFLSATTQAGVEAVAVDPFGGWLDPDRQVSRFIRCDPSLFCREVVRRVGAVPRPEQAAGGSAWATAWQRAESAARTVVTTMLGAGGDPVLTEPSLAHRLFARVPAEATLVVSSSMPIRDLEAFALPRPHGPRVLSNRGANGIDGVVSTALGVALGTPGPTVGLVGDLAFLHDVSALVRSDGFGPDLTVVVADNDGGGIFSFLGPASVLDPVTFDTLFGTPQLPDVAAVAAGFGWPVDEVGPDDGPDRLDQVLDRRLAGGGVSVIRVRLPARPDNVAVHRRINDAIVEAVDAAVDAADGDQQGVGS